jgi:O-succinylbenzoic acid--CoA ligase
VKVQLEKVEKVFMEMVGQTSVTFSRAFAYGVTDEQLGQRLVMLLEKPLKLTENGFEEISKDQSELVSLREKMQKVLSKYEIPKQFYAVSSFSETPTGKIDKIATIKRLNL